MLFTTTFLLSAAMISRAEASDSSPNYLTNRLTAATEEDLSHGDSLGMPAPQMGGLNQPCYTSGEPCDYGLHCHYHKEGTAWFGKCVRDHHPHKGGHGEPCRDNGSCDHGLTCERKHMLPSGVAYICEESTLSPVPSPTPSPDGEAGGNCNRPPLAPCNHSNLKAKYVHLLGGNDAYACTCEYWLGGTTDDDNRLGMPAPHTGSEGEPCANGDECDSGLRCHYTTDGSAIFGTCRPSSTPSPRPPVTPQTGGLGQPCRYDEYHNGLCNAGLYCELTYDGSAVFGTCVEGWTAPPSPSPQPSNQRGGLNERCHKDGSCDAGQPTYTHLFGQALSYPVCYCLESGLLGASTGTPRDSTKLGMPAPHMGREGEPCKKGAECEDGLTCHYTTDGSAIFGTCRRDFSFFARKGEKCGVSAGWGNPFFCEWGSWCKAERLLGCTGNDCTTHICTAYSLGDSNAPGSAPLPGN